MEEFGIALRRFGAKSRDLLAEGLGIGRRGKRRFVVRLIDFWLMIVQYCS